MGKPNVSSDAVEEATSSVSVLVEAMRGRIADLKMIWRRQRMDVDTQIRYYANGLLEDYYRVGCFPICQAVSTTVHLVVRNTARKSLIPIWRISNKANGTPRTSGLRMTELKVGIPRKTRTRPMSPSKVSD